LYLYMTLTSDGYRPSMNFVARSALPVGAGLGSSAAYSTCIATTLLLIHGHISVPSNGELELTHHTTEVNQWAFLAEKVLHGNPSGVDNAVSVHGGAIAFTRSVKGPKMVAIQGFKSIRFLLTNTKIPRDTKSLVAGVGLKKQKEPELVDGILQQIQRISDEAQTSLSADPPLPRTDLSTILDRLIEENHAHLITLGVSHERLERIREVVRKKGLKTKLTGAGGGGCAVTLVPDGFDEVQLRAVAKELEQEGFEVYETSVGGRGFGVLLSNLEAGSGEGTDLANKPTAELSSGWPGDWTFS